MNLPEFFQFKKKERRPLVKNFDQVLVKKVNKKRLPNLSQLKYFFYFLNKKEKVSFWSSFTVGLATALIWLMFFIFENIAVLPTVGGEYIEGLVGTPKLINPIFESANDIDMDISALIYAKLFKYDENKKLVPELIDNYILSEDKKIYTFKLKDEIYWSNGNEITTDDVAFTFDAIQNPEVGSPLFSSFQGIIFEKIDNKQFSLALKEPFSPFLNSLVLGIVPEKIFGQINPTNLKLAKDNLQPTLVSGPYIFTKMVKDNFTNKIQSYTLQRNEKYYGKKPYLNSVIFKFYDSYDQALDDLRNQHIHGLSFVPYELKEKISGKNFNFYDLQLPQYVALFFNQVKEKVLKDENLRLCLATSLNKKMILEEVLKNNGQIVSGPILKNEIGFHPEIKKVNFNIEEANNLLDKSWSRIEPEKFLELREKQILKELNEKYPATNTTSASSTEEVVPNRDLNQEARSLAEKELDSEHTFYRKNKNDNILSLIITTVDTPEYKKTAELIAAAWKKIGIQTFVELIDSKKIIKENIRERNYSILLFGEILGGDPDPYAFWHSSQIQSPGLNLALFSDKDADKLLEDARTTDDITKREDFYKKFQDILAKKIPAIFLYTPTYYYAVDKNIKGINVGSILIPADRFSSFNKWYIKTAKQWK